MKMLQRHGDVCNSIHTCFSQTDLEAVTLKAQATVGLPMKHFSALLFHSPCIDVPPLLLLLVFSLVWFILSLHILLFSLLFPPESHKGRSILHCALQKRHFCSHSWCSHVLYVPTACHVNVRHTYHYCMVQEMEKNVIHS